jgi:glycosyltransferase involved in cell wall biosynthesis
MKIIQVIDTLNVGGAEKVFVDMSNILFENQQEISVLLLLEGGVLKPELNSKIKLYELSRTNKWSIKKMQECSKIVQSFDIIHCHFRHVYRYISLVKLLFPFKGKVVLQDHYGSIEVHKKVPFLFASVFKPAYYIGVSKTLTDWAENSLSVSAKNVFLLENIIIQNNVKTPNIKHYDLILVSNIKPIKNNLFAIQLAQKMNKRLVLIGQNQDSSYFDTIRLSFTDNIEINATISNAQSVMHWADFGLHTSISETGPLVLIEYIAKQLPFLAYETGEVAKTLKKYFPLYFIDNFDLAQWQERIEKIKENPLDYAKFEHVFEIEFGQTKYYQKLKAIYLCIQINA